MSKGQSAKENRAKAKQRQEKPLSASRQPGRVSRTLAFIVRHYDWSVPFAVWLIFWWPVISGQMQLFARDLTFYAYPLKTEMMARFSQGDFPFWTQHISGGMPFFAELSNQVLYPLNILFALTPGAVSGISWMIILHHLLSFFTMRYFAKTVGLAKPYTLWVCLLYGFSGYVLGIGDNINYQPAIAWLPLALAFFHKGWSAFSQYDADETLGIASSPANAGTQSFYMPHWKPLLANGALCALSIALMLFAGDTFNPLFLGIFASSLVAYSLIARLFHPGMATAAALGFYSRMLVFWLTCFALALGLFAVQLLPTLELTQLSVRQTALKYEEVVLWSFPWERLVEWVVPYFYGTRFPEPRFLGMFLYPAFREPWADSVYVGLITVFFAVLGVTAAHFSGRYNNRWVWVWLILCSVLLALGGNAFYYPLLIKIIPILSTQRYLEKFIFPVAIGMSLLAGFGASISPVWLTSLRDWLETKKSRNYRMGLTVALFIGAAVLLIQIPTQLWIWPHYYERSTDWGEHFYERGEHVLGLYWHYAVVVIPLLALLWIQRRWFHMMSCLLMVLAVLDLIAVHWPHVPKAPSALLVNRPEPVALGAIKKLARQKQSAKNNPHLALSPIHLYYDDKISVEELTDESRMLKRIEEAYHLPYLSDPFSYYWIYRVLYNQERLLFNYGMAYGMSYQNGRFAPLQQRLHKQMDVVLAEHSLPDLMELSNVQYIITPIHPKNAVWERPGYREVFRDAPLNLKIISVTDTLPRAYIAPTPLWNSEPADVYLNLTDTVSALPKNQWVELSSPETARSPIRQTPKLPAIWFANLPNEVSVRVDQPEEIILRFHSPYPKTAYLVLTESWFPGWRAVLDDKTELTPLIANHRFMAVPVPTGKHQVRFTYQSQFFNIGLMVSLLSLALCVGLIGLCATSKASTDMKRQT